LRFICQLAETGSELSVTALSALVSEAVDLVVHCVRRGPLLRVTEVLAVEDLQVATGNVTFTTTSLFARARFGDPLAWTGNLPVRAARALELSGFDVRSLANGDGPG
jgi:pilus assembly protein CpaF